MTIEKWRERIILPRILLTLEDFCAEEDIDGFESFSAAFNALPDPLLVIAFMPFDDSCVSLSPSDIHQRISADCLLETDVSVAVPCHLGIQFVGVVGHELKKLLQDVSSPFSKQACSDMSVKSMHSSIGNLMVGHHSMAVTWQSQDSPVPSDADD